MLAFARPVWCTALISAALALLAPAANAACQNSVDFTGAALGATRTLDVSTCASNIVRGLYASSGLNTTVFNQPLLGNTSAQASTFSTAAGSITITPNGSGTTFNSYTVKLNAYGSANNATVTLWYAPTPQFSQTSVQYPVTIANVPTIPTVTAVTPNTAPPAGVANGVAITGTGFTGATDVTIGGVSVPGGPVVTNNGTTVQTLVVPPGTLGSASVNVVTPAGTSANNALFTYALQTQAITFGTTPAPIQLAAGSSYKVTANGGGSGNPVTITSGTPAVCSVPANATSPATVTFLAAGTCAINANQAGVANVWAAAPQAVLSLSVQSSCGLQSGNYSCTVVTAADPGTSSDGTVGAPGTLSFALAYANSVDASTTSSKVVTININLPAAPNNKITLAGPLSPMFNSTTINGNGAIIDGGGTQRIFMAGVDFLTQKNAAYAGTMIAQTPAIAINNLTLQNGLAKGGAGGNAGGGGGGLGAGGALFVNQSANVTLTNVSFVSNKAQGGAGAGAGFAFSSGGGGSGLGSAGAGAAFNGGGGGGLFGASSNDSGGGLFGADTGANQPGLYSGNANPPGKLQIAGLSLGNIGDFGSGGGQSGTNAAFGGGGGGQGAAGAFGGGGAGNASGVTFKSGFGGFGGGGGGGSGGNGVLNVGGDGGNGGFGGGGGGGGAAVSASQFNSSGGVGGFGGSAGGAGFVSVGGVGGNGAAMGGAIFVVRGGQLTVNGGSETGSAVTAGGNGASAFGAGIFAQGSPLIFGAGDFSLSDSIADMNGSGGSAASSGVTDGITATIQNGGSTSLTKNGAGTLTLSGTHSYTGATTVNGGTLLLTSGADISASSGISVNGAMLSGGGKTPGIAFAGGASLQASIAPAGSTLINATGPASLGANTAVNVAFTSGAFSAGQTFTILQAPSITGTFTFNPTNVPAGMTAQFARNNTVLQVKLIAAPTLAITDASLGSATVGATDTLSATFTNAASPTGVVGFFDGGVSIGSANIANGVATLANYQWLNVGTHSINASYAGDANNAAAAAPSFTQNVLRAAPNLTMSSTTPPTVFSQPLTITGTVTGGFQPTGAVALRVDGTSVGSPNLAGGAVSFTTLSLAAGAHTADGAYGGDANNSPSPITGVTAINFTVNKANQVISFSSTAPANAIVGGAPYTIAANSIGVVPASTGSTGLSVTFTSATTSICAVSGATVSFVGAGTCTINADQVGSGNYNAAPTAQQSFAVAAATVNIAYQGGPVMLPFIAVYPVFWAPATLQNGGATGYSPLYGTIAVLASAWTPGHAPFAVATQYAQTVSGTSTFINNGGGLGGYTVDTTAYPAGGCTHPTSGANCITDAQIRSELTNRLNAVAWTGGMSNIFTVLLSSNEGVCMDATNASCSYRDFCSYHSAFTLNGQPVIYAVIPYANAAACSGAGATSPNADVGDAMATELSRQIANAAADPLANGWRDPSTGNGIADVCAKTYGGNGWTNPANTIAASAMWNGWYFEDQAVWNQHMGVCAMVGP